MDVVIEDDGTESTGDPVPGSTITTTTLPDGTVTTSITYGTTGPTLDDPAIFPLGEDSGIFAGRSAISDALGRAEEILAGYLGYGLGKKQYCDTVPWPKLYNGCVNRNAIVQMPRGKIDAIGRIEDVKIADLNITLRDFNNDLLIDGFAGGGFYAAVDMTQDDPDSFYLRHKNADELGCSYQGFSDTQISFKRGPGGTYINVVGPLHEIIKPELITASSAAGTSSAPRVVVDPCIYVNCIELVQRRLNSDSSAYGNILSSCGGCNVCSDQGGDCTVCSQISACVVNGALGTVQLTALGGCNTGELKSATIHYVGGDCCDNWEEIIARLAVAELGSESFQVPSFFAARWGGIGTGLDNPLGDRVGHEYAWRFIQEKRSTSRGVILA